jgi:G:T-mismatch repair DNA endonuclease (very short patch repair protein)
MPTINIAFRVSKYVLAAMPLMKLTQYALACFNHDCFSFSGFKVGCMSKR